MEWPSHESIYVNDAQGDGNSYVKLIEGKYETRPIGGLGIAYRSLS